MGRKCMQTYASALPRQTSTAGGLLICPCETEATKTPIRIGIGSVAFALPWSLMMKPVEDKPGFCMLRIHAAAATSTGASGMPGSSGAGYIPSIGGVLLATHLLMIDYGMEKVGICMPKAD